MATEAEIIPEQPIPLVKTGEESKDLTLGQRDKAVEFLPDELKKLEGGIIQPTETNECSEKAENMELAGNKGAGIMKTASEGDAEISKGESFLVSPEISKVANETCRMSDHSEVYEAPKSIIKEECAIVDNSEKSTEEENAAAVVSIKEVCKESETALADISYSSISDETVKESIKEEESSPMKSTEEANDSNIEETAKPSNDPSLFNIVKESKEEIAPIEVKEDLACSSSFELKELKNDTEEGTSVKGSINTADSDSASPAAETNIKEVEAETEKEKKEIDNVLDVEEKDLARTEHEGISVDTAAIDVKPVDSSITCEKEKEVTHEDGMRAPFERTDTPVPQATDEILMQKEENPTLDVPKVESEDTGKESVHEVKEHLDEEPSVQTEPESGKCSTVSEVTNVSNGEQSSDFGLETEKTEDKKPLDSTDLGEAVSTCKDGEKAIQEEESLAKDLAKPESLKEDTEIGKEETELPSRAQDQIPEVVNVNDEAKNVELALAGFEEKLKSESEPVAEVQSNETLPESSKSQADETSTNVHNQESEKQIKQEPDDSEQNADQVTKAVILSEEVDKEVEKADDSEDIKEHAKEEDYSSVSPECLKKADSKEQIEASPIVEETEERRQDEESGNPVSVHDELRESEEKIEDIVDESKLCQDKSDIEAVTKLREETSLNDTDVSSVMMSRGTTESDANQEAKEVQLEEISSDLAPKVLINDSDEVEKQSLNVEIVEEDQAKVSKIDEAEKSLTSNADELKKTESPADGDHVFEDKGTEQDAETKQGLTVELEANKVKETKSVPETSSHYLAQRVETIVEDDTSSHMQEEKPDKQLQTSVSALPSEDEEIRTASPIEKKEEDSSETKAIEEVCLQEGDQRVPKAVSEEETIVDHGLQKEEPEELIQSTSSTLVSSEERGQGTAAIGEEIENGKTTEELITKLDVVTGDEITGEQTLLANKPEGGTTSSVLVSKELEGENVSRVEKTEEKIKEAEIPDKISEDSSDAKKTAEICLAREEIQELEGAKKDDAAAAAQALQVGEPNEQSLTSPSALPSENLEHGTPANVNEVEEEKEQEAEKLEKQSPQEPDAVVDQEINVAQASITEKSVEIETISTVEKPQEEKGEEAENLENERCEDSSARETEEKNELHALPKEEITSAVTSEELENESKKTEDEKPNKEDTMKDKVREDASDARTMEETCSQKERSIELEAVVEEEVQNPTSALPSKEEECISTSTVPVSSQVQEDEALAKGENASSETLQMEKLEEQIPEPVVTLPSDEHKHETFNEVDKTEEEKAKEEEIQNEDSNGAKKVEGIGSEKDDTKWPQAVLEGETIASQVIEEEPQGHGILREEKKIKEAETQEDEISPQSECPRELQGTIEDKATAVQTLPGQKPEDQLHITTSILPSDIQEDETKETKLKEDESPQKIPEQTREIEEASSVKLETNEKAFDNKLLAESENAAIEEKPVQAKDETGGEENQCEKTYEGNEIILNKISKEEVMEDKGVTETSYSTPHSEVLTKGGSGEDELKNKRIEDKTNDALETKCQTEELVVEAQKTSENEIIKKQVILEDKTVENPGQASAARIETATVTEEESSTALSQAEGSKDFAEGNEKINDTQQPEETTNIASDKQIPREFDPIENTEISSPIELQDRAAESSQKAEAESPTKETFQPEEQSPAPSSKLPSEKENGVKTRADAVEEKPKEVGTLEKDSSDTKTGEEMCLEKEENKKELKAVQTPPTEIEESASRFDNGCKEVELKDEHTGVLSVEALKDGVNNNIEKEIVAEDKTVKDLEQASVGIKEATIVREEVPAKADPIESSTTSSISKEHFPTEQQERALEPSEKPGVGDLEPGKAQQICSEAGIDHGEEIRTDNTGMEISQEPASADLGKLSLSDLLQRSTEETMQVTERVIEERKTESKEEQHWEEEETIKVKEAKREDEKDEGEEGDEHNKADSGPDAPVMVEAPRDTDTKPHKKSHNILSGVGSKVKHSISKVKKAITGKSSHSKESKPISPKESEK